MLVIMLNIYQMHEYWARPSALQRAVAGCGELGRFQNYMAICFWGTGGIHKRLVNLFIVVLYLPPKLFMNTRTAFLKLDTGECTVKMPSIRIFCTMYSFQYFR